MLHGLYISVFIIKGDLQYVGIVLNGCQRNIGIPNSIHLYRFYKSNIISWTNNKDLCCWEWHYTVNIEDFIITNINVISLTPLYMFGYSLVDKPFKGHRQHVCQTHCRVLKDKVHRMRFCQFKIAWLFAGKWFKGNATSHCFLFNGRECVLVIVDSQRAVSSIITIIYFFHQQCCV